MLEDDEVRSHLEAEGIYAENSPERLLADGGESLEDVGGEEGRLSRIRSNISGKYDAASEAAPESPLFWLGAAGTGGWIVNQTEDEAWDSFAREMPEYGEEALDKTALAADYAADAGVDALMAGYNLGEATAVGAVALGTLGAAGKAVQTYRNRRSEE